MKVVKYGFRAIALIAVVVIAGCSGSLSSIPKPKIEFTDVLPTTPVSDVARTASVTRQAITIQLMPTENNTATADIGMGTATVDTNGNLVVSISSKAIQVSTASIGYLTVSASVNISFDSHSAADIESYSINARLRDKNALTTAESSSVVPVYVAVDGSDKFHLLSTDFEQLVSTSSSRLANGRGSHTFKFRFDMSQVELSAFSGVVVLELTETLTATQKLNGTLQAALLGKGINIGNGLEEVPEGNNDTGIVVAASDFKNIRSAGFNTVRIPINWADRVGEAPTYTIPASFFTRIDQVIQQALDADLNVILDNHGYSTKFSQNPAGESAKLTAIWQQIASRYQNKSSRVYYELFNEPTDQISANTWNGIQNNLIQSIRAIDSFHTIIVTGVSWSTPESLSGLSLTATSNIIAMVHFYDPILFTHQGASWMGTDYSVTGITWPGPPTQFISPPQTLTSWVLSWFTDYKTKTGDNNPASLAQVKRQLDIASAWQSSHVPVYIGEFGTYKMAVMSSRAAWTNAVRLEAEKRGFSWAYWEYASGFGAYDPISKSWRTELLNALTQ